MCRQSRTPNTKIKIRLLMFLLFLTAVLAAALSHISIRLFIFGSLVGGTQQHLTWLVRVGTDTIFYFFDLLPRKFPFNFHGS